VFTNDNATVYKISETFLIPTITHQTPVKERHAILQGFRSGEYPTLVVSHVLNEGVDVPEARVAILLSGSGSIREYVQRLGRILRKGSGNKQAVLYEVVAEETTEEGLSSRRRQGVQTSPSGPRQLELVPVKPVYSRDPLPVVPRAAEAPPPELDAPP
jgi:superfamily II DNA or RNA helicase